MEKEPQCRRTSHKIMILTANILDLRKSTVITIADQQNLYYNFVLVLLILKIFFWY